MTSIKTALSRRNKTYGLDWLFELLVYTMAIIAVLITLLPFVYVIMASMSSAEAVFGGKVFLWPVDFTLGGYKQVLTQRNLWTAYGNTLLYTSFGTLFNIAATALAAYPLAQRRFFARKFLNFFITFTMYFSGGLIPTYLVITSLGLYNSRWVMILPGLLSTYNVMVCRTAFAAIPEEIIESAEIDGANDLRIFFSLAIRLVGPTLAVLTLYYAVGHWNNFFTALMYLSKEDLMPLQVLLRRVLIESSGELLGNNIQIDQAGAISIQIRYVTIVVATLPILLIYPLLQRYFVKGVMLGAVKG